MSIATRSSPSTITARALTAGHRAEVRFNRQTCGGPSVRYPTTTNSSSSPGKTPEGEGVVYAVIDNNRGVRGPASIWGNGYETDDQLARSLHDLVDGRSEVSRRPGRWAQTRIAAVLLPVSPPSVDGEQR